MTKKFEITGIEQAQYSEDRSSVETQFQTPEGPLTLFLKSSDLAGLASMLAHIESQQASLGVPGLTGEPQQFRVEIVNFFEAGTVQVGDTPHVLLTLEAGPIRRHFAINKELAERVSEGIETVLPDLASTAGPN